MGKTSFTLLYKKFQICELNAETRNMEETFKSQFEEKQQQLDELKEKLKVLQPTLDDLNE